MKEHGFMTGIYVLLLGPSHGESSMVLVRLG